ncbi:MAG: tRNA pseudouridine(38-40) synthase TruA [Glaciihabitans sp.]|jgi:tRNA pseudouridine38-40 synthase|nr:tRNA pseudouridine(38-40) synthase TruA [Glaciihabitans sp.]
MVAVESELTRLRIDLAYDGSGFTGWSKQPGLRTVQGELEAALATIFSKYPPVPTLTVAGRTDAGVHSAGQVAHVDLTAAQFASLDSHRRGKGRGARVEIGDKLARKLNGLAGAKQDIRVNRVAVAPPGFDARFSANFRRYAYRIADPLAAHDPIRRNDTLWYPAALDVGAMNHAAISIVGLHDFAAYCKPREGATTIRTLEEFAWEREPDGVLVARLRADAFCHSMVRALVGATVAVGEGKLPADRVAGILANGQRTSEFKVMPAKGLSLLEVGYPADEDLAARAEQTRARRDAAQIDRDGAAD